jgi:chromosome partitioning protein
MRKILIANPKGGVGKSTVATNLAGGLARLGHRVMLGDVDRQQSSRLWLGLRPPGLPPIQGWDIEPDQPAKPPKGTTHAVLDTPAGLHGKKLRHLLERIDTLLVPLQPSLFDIYATRAFLDELQEILQRRDAVRIGLIAMRVDARTIAAAEAERFLGATGLPVVTHLRDTQNYVRAAAHGMTVFDLPPSQGRPDVEDWEPLLAWVDRP